MAARLRATVVPAQFTPYPATGRDRAWANLTPQGGTAAGLSAGCWGPATTPAERLCDYAEQPIAVIQRSCATAAGGVTAGVTARPPPG